MHIQMGPGMWQNDWEENGIKWYNSLNYLRIVLFFTFVIICKSCDIIISSIFHHHAAITARLCLPIHFPVNRWLWIRRTSCRQWSVVSVFAQEMHSAPAGQTFTIFLFLYVQIIKISYGLHDIQIYWPSDDEPKAIWGQKIILQFQRTTADLSFYSVRTLALIENRHWNT